MGKHLGLGVYAQARCGILPTHTLAPISSPTPPPAPTAPPVVHGCEHWCSADTRAWSNKCNFPLCNGCSVCPSSLVEEVASKTSVVIRRKKDVGGTEDDTSTPRSYCWCWDYYHSDYVRTVFFKESVVCSEEHEGSYQAMNAGKQLPCKEHHFASRWAYGT